MFKIVSMQYFLSVYNPVIVPPIQLSSNLLDRLVLDRLTTHLEYNYSFYWAHE